MYTTVYWNNRKHIPGENLKNWDYIKFKDFSQPCGRHFNQRGHVLSDMTATILEKVYSNDKLLRGERKSMWIRNFNSTNRGLNRKTLFCWLQLFHPPPPSPEDIFKVRFTNQNKLIMTNRLVVSHINVNQLKL